MSALPASVLPLNSEQTNQLRTAVSGLSASQLQWVSGYVAGLAAADTGNAVATAVPAAVGQSLTVLFGSQTGNGEEVANALAASAQARGYAAKAVNLADYKPANVKRESLLSFVISTHGEGDPPDDAELFREFLLSENAPSLPNLKYAVLALGDSSYVNFCQTGRELDARLAELGAQRFADITECDLDYEALATDWEGRVLEQLGDLLDAPASNGVAQLHAVETGTSYGKNNPFPAEVLVNQKITGGSSSKDVRHIELSLEGSGLSYEPGDSLAVVVNNPPLLVAELIATLTLDGDAEVQIGDDAMTLHDALSERLEITAVNLKFLRYWADVSNADALQQLLESEQTDELAAFVENHQIVDVVRQFAASINAQQLVDGLRKLSPRSYSISSSILANPDEVHITVAAVRYTAFDREHWGAASTHLADRIAVGDTVQVFIDKNSRFRLPAQESPIIMIGPGTGVAPFRAFVEQRIEQGATGQNWLFFGDRNFDSDFLYQLEWQRYLKQGHLTKLDVAFSRDQRDKIYVQDRIREHATEIQAWIDEGAAIYVCGDAKRMAGDVHEALLDVVSKQKNLQRSEAEQILRDLKSAGRYQRDVY